MSKNYLIRIKIIDKYLRGAILEDRISNRGEFEFYNLRWGIQNTQFDEN